MKVFDTDRLGSCAYYVHNCLVKTAFLYELARVRADEGGNAVTRLMQIFELLKKLDIMADIM